MNTEEHTQAKIAELRAALTATVSENMRLRIVLETVMRSPGFHKNNPRLWARAKEALRPERVEAVQP